MAPNVCTTQQAAKLLGVSVTSVQQLVETGVLEAWKTKGGHRRIPLASIQAYMDAPARELRQFSRTEGSAHTNKILIVEDNPMQQEIHKKQILSWTLDAQLEFCTNGYQALIEIAQQRPDIVLTDIVMPGIDGCEMISTIKKYPELSKINIAVLTALSREELEQRATLPGDVTFFQKPVNYDELRGYLRACFAFKAKNDDS